MSRQKLSSLQEHTGTLAMASQPTQHQGKLSPAQQVPHIDHLPYNYHNQLLQSTTGIQKPEPRSVYKVFYMNGPLVNVNPTVTGSNNNGSTLQASMNPNANLFVPRVIYTQHPQQVYFKLWISVT